MLVSKLCLRQKKPKTPPQKKNLTKKLCPRLLECSERHIFKVLRNPVFEGVFGFFDKGKPYFMCIKEEDFRLK